MSKLNCYSQRVVEACSCSRVFDVHHGLNVDKELWQCHPHKCDFEMLNVCTGSVVLCDFWCFLPFMFLPLKSHYMTA